MSKWNFERTGYLAGAAFPILGITGVIMNEAGKGEWPGSIESETITTSELVDYYSGTAATRFSYLIMLASAIALGWFAYSLRTRFLRSEPGDARLARIAYGLGTFSAGAWLLLVAMAAGMERYDASQIQPEFLSGLYSAEHLTNGVWYLAIAPMPFLLGIAAYLGLKHNALPRFLAWGAAALAVPGLLGVLLWPIDSKEDGFFLGLAWIGSMAFMLWALIAGIALAASRKSTGVAQAPQKPSEPGAPADDSFVVAAV